MLCSLWSHEKCPFSPKTFSLEIVYLVLLLPHAEQHFLSQVGLVPKASWHEVEKHHLKSNQYLRESVMCSYNFLWAFLNKVQSCRVDWFYERHPLSDGHIAPTQPPKLSRWGHSWFFGTGVTKAAWSQMGFSSCPVLEVQCWQQKQESQAQGDRHALRLWGGKAT